VLQNIAIPTKIEYHIYIPCFLLNVRQKMKHGRKGRSSVTRGKNLQHIFLKREFTLFFVRSFFLYSKVCSEI